MRVTRPAGRNAAVIKYDLLTALGALGCAGDKHQQRLVLRFVTLIVARYNWAADELAAGQREIAALWAVDERTVKREMARLRELGWLVTKRPAARGRVAVHGLDLPAILSATAARWNHVGPDFAARMGGREDAGEGAAQNPPQGNVISFPAVPRPEGQGVWSRIQTMLHAENPALFSAWFAALQELPGDGTRLQLRAPSRFHAVFVETHHLMRLTTLARKADPGLTGVDIQT
jgi:hypothetical protein